LSEQTNESNNAHRRERKSTRRLLGRVVGKELVLTFEGEPAKRWKLPSTLDKDKIGIVRRAAVLYAAQHGATVGQQAYVRRVLWENGYGSGKPQRNA
jgi:hypothetical protein